MTKIINIVTTEKNDINHGNDTIEILQEKLADAENTGYPVEFDPQEAEAAGAFIEDALTEEDARESSADIYLNNSEG
jgi:hypothetical protein